MPEAKPAVLVVDDEPAIRRLLHVILTTHGYAVAEAALAGEALSRAASAPPDVIVLDLGLPDMDGVELTQLLRQWTQVPILVLSVRGAERDKVAALDAGADDYLTKPFGAAELLARLRVALRRREQPAPDSIFKSGDLTVDLGRRLALLNGEEVQLTPTEYNLLRVMVTNAGRVLTAGNLLREVWGEAYLGEMHLLRVNVSNLRHKLEADPSRPRHILTEPGVGYRLRADPQ